MKEIVSNFLNTVKIVLIIAITGFTVLTVVGVSLELYSEQTGPHYPELAKYIQTHGLTEEAAIKQLDSSERFRRLLEVVRERKFTEQHAIDRMKYVVTRYDCHQYLAEYMQTNNLSAEDVAKILDRRIGTVKRILQRKALPTDEMIARVEGMLIMGPPIIVPPFDPGAGPVTPYIISDIWDWTKSHWPFVDDDSEFIIDQTIERPIKQ